MNYQAELRRLPIRVRNQVRAILALNTDDAIPRLNLLRDVASASELAQVERILFAFKDWPDALVPSNFPIRPQTTEGFTRLRALTFDKQVHLVELHCREHVMKLLGAIQLMHALGLAITSYDYAQASVAACEFLERFGYSHFLLRKAVLLRTLRSDVEDPGIEAMLVEAGLHNNHVVVTSLLHSFQEQHDFLNLKRSLLHLPDKGSANKFTRDICRIPFQPLARDQDDFKELLQSTMQCSLIDALIVAKVNRHLLPKPSDFPTLFRLFDAIDQGGVSPGQIAGLYDASDAESEHIFYKRSSAWLENSAIVEYRVLPDHFYDHPESSYSRITPEVIARISQWVVDGNLDDLATATRLTKHEFSELAKLEIAGSVTRSAIFNFRLYVVQGFTTILEDNLVNLMGQTRDLAKTVSTSNAKHLAAASSTQLSKLILYLLIAKKSRNEKDDHQLRRVLQQIAKNEYSSDLIQLLSGLANRSDAIARYAYDVCTEDFIAKLFHLVPETADITEVRANTHRWMGRYTGEKVYFDRARTLIIDHQINKVRNELDDHRIYVNSGRFKEWLDDEVTSELTTLLSALEHHGELSDGSYELILVLIERCYAAFCSNKIFGIASYLGRRIRHGTFKGHLFSSLVRIENDPRYERLMWDHSVVEAWNAWKSWYEARISEIIRERLHVASPEKKDGLLKPKLDGPIKRDIATACAKDLVRDFSETLSAANSSFLITEYCWRLVEVDLREFNAYLKGQRRVLLTVEHFSSFRGVASADLSGLAHEFCRELVRSTDERFRSMYGWFKRPQNVAPKASLQLLFKAVVEEVKVTFPDANADLDVNPETDVELFGGVYHVLYDAFYVVVYNAAKHGQSGGRIEPRFSIASTPSGGQLVVASITSEVRDGQSDQEVRDRLELTSENQIDDAHLYENRSGIPKLHQLRVMDEKFSIVKLAVNDRKVEVAVSYVLGH